MSERQQQATDFIKGFAHGLTLIANQMREVNTDYWGPGPFAHLDARADELERIAENLRDDASELDSIYAATGNIYRQEARRKREAGGDE